MLKYENIRQVEIELSSNCSATCPLCSRNTFGYNMDLGFPKLNLSLDQVRNLLDPVFIKQLTTIIFQGNFGDFSSNKETPSIVRYFLEHNPGLKVKGHTHGNLQNNDWWASLVGMHIIFALDGLEDTHSLYRRNTSWSKTIEHAKAFIQAGGTATWKMIEFDHNRHQIDECRQMAHDLGMHFYLQPNLKNSGPVFNQKKEYLHSINNHQGSKNFEDYIREEILLEDIILEPVDYISCESLDLKGIFIQSNGEVYPCCYMAHYPDTYGKGRWAEPYNKQLLELREHNNAFEHGLKHSIEWFKNIPGTWDIDSFEDGRLLYCHTNCGKCNKG